MASEEARLGIFSCLLFLTGTTIRTFTEKCVDSLANTPEKCAVSALRYSEKCVIL